MATSQEIHDWAMQEYETLKKDLKEGELVRLVQGDDTCDPITS